ncbi:ferredoxin--NADP reductase [Croceitalea vernalis]|uniref:Ferredoxin--NADP reductase n=1 Tax=Croceitalea vernalis TaxID=3075599 RepID=A0ABU3BED0_9FLAO|nr:ferredoxin--NADP reductase [Croceitalea sp. P007]MDT0620525.1 ferredoxin--NADP reductase [Croceitalea sp. P007]
MSDFHSLTVSSVERLTPSSVALSFNITEDLKDTFSFSAGQYITLKQTINGEEIRRAYSISSAPSSGKLTVGIKKVPNGIFSTYANESITSGDTIEVMPPDGRFIFEGNQQEKTIAAFAAGSGITPIMSIAETVLKSNENNRFVLVLGNQTPEEAMYRDAILQLQKHYFNRFYVQFIYSRSTEENCLFGRIETSTVNLITKNKFKDFDFDAFYLCGPEEMITTVSESLTKNGVAESKILFELFTSSSSEDTIVENLDGKTKIQVVVDDEEFSFTMDQKEFVLDAVLKEDIDAPYSCQGGVCSSCIARVTEGKAEMVKNQILTESEVAEGLILTCQAHATTPNLKVDYDDV